jgi:hypothetical protein
MAGYKRLPETELAWRDNRDQVKLDIRKITRRLENEVLDELDEAFNAGISRGEILELRPGDAAIANLLKEKANQLALEKAEPNADTQTK